jgi:hypothetical protein
MQAHFGIYYGSKKVSPSKLARTIESVDNGNSVSPASKTRSVTFRLDANVIDELQNEADAKDMSLNVLVNQILRRYVNWDRYETKIGMMPVPKLMLSTLIDESVAVAKRSGVNEAEIVRYKNQIVQDAAQIAFSMMKDSVLYMKKQYNLWAVLSVLQEYMKVSGIKSDHTIEGRKHIFLVQHELGESWSLFTKELLHLIFNELGQARAEIKVTRNTTIAEVNL